MCYGGKVLYSKSYFKFKLVISNYSANFLHKLHNNDHDAHQHRQHINNNIYR